MNPTTQHSIITRLKEEWILITSLVVLVITTLLWNTMPRYEIIDTEIVFGLWVLLVLVKGLENQHIFEYIALRVENHRKLPLILVGLTAGFAVLFTNDVAILTIVPLTLSLKLESRKKTDLIILETAAANVFSGLSPLGSPQSFFIYYFYKVSILEFLTAMSILVFTIGGVLVFLLWLLVGWSNHFPTVEPSPSSFSQKGEQFTFSTKLLLYLIFFLLFLLAILHVFPLWIGIPLLIYVALWDRESLQVDYSLLFTFICFFGFTSNVYQVLHLTLSNDTQVFWITVLLSQVLSNVPATLLVADFTFHWKALLWGATVGAFGTLVGSLANIITYRLNCRKGAEGCKTFFLRFHFINGVLLVAGGVICSILLHDLPLIDL